MIIAIKRIKNTLKTNKKNKIKFLKSKSLRGIIYMKKCV